jgi:MazG family protein
LNDTLSAVAELIRLIARLRGPDGCPWDRKQTPQSMVRYLLEEAYELSDAIESGHAADACEELGDVLFHVLFITWLYGEQQRFGLAEVAGDIIAKMTRRHPHVFGTVEAADSEQVVLNWQKIKRREKPQPAGGSVLDNLPKSLPALLRAYAVSERAGRAGFDWSDMAGVMAKLEEELAELRDALAAQDARQAARELGDVFFTLVHVARFAGVHPEGVLSGATHRFEWRFRQMEDIIAASGRKIEDVSQSEKDRIWNGIKASEA